MENLWTQRWPSGCPDTQRCFRIPHGLCAAQEDLCLAGHGGHSEGLVRKEMMQVSCTGDWQWLGFLGTVTSLPSTAPELSLLLLSPTSSEATPLVWHLFSSSNLLQPSAGLLALQNVPCPSCLPANALWICSWEIYTPSATSAEAGVLFPGSSGFPAPWLQLPCLRWTGSEEGPGQCGLVGDV